MPLPTLPALVPPVPELRPRRFHAPTTCRRIPPPARGTHRVPRRRDGHDDPGAPPGRGRLPRRALSRLAPRPQGQQRPPDAHAAAHHRVDPPRVPRSGRGRHRDQYVQFLGDLAGRLRHRRAGARAELRGRAPRAPRRRRSRARHRHTAFRGRSARPDQPNGLAVARCQRSGDAQRHLRGIGGDVRRGGARAARGRRGSAAGRNHLRHPQRQGRAVCRAPRDRRTGRGGPARRFRHDHGCVGTYALRPDHRGVLELDPPCAATGRRPELCAGCATVATLRRGAGAPG